MIRMEVLDPTTKAGFLEIASAAGRERAHDARVAAYASLYERDRDYRWHGERWLRAMHSAEFERDYERANPQVCQMLRDNGIGY